MSFGPPFPSLGVTGGMDVAGSALGSGRITTLREDVVVNVRAVLPEIYKIISTVSHMSQPVCCNLSIPMTVMAVEEHEGTLNTTLKPLQWKDDKEGRSNHLTLISQAS
jgi:hypothetical protein